MRIKSNIVWFWAIGLAALSLAIVLGSANLWLGDLNQDEGWYLYASTETAAGRIPYLDFAFTQGPVLPFFYALFRELILKGGLLSGRLITSLLGFLSAIFASTVAYRFGKRSREDSTLAWSMALATFILIACNVYQSYFTTVVKTYGLSTFFLTAGFLALSFRENRRFGGMASFWSGFLMALAAGTRLSAGIALPLVGCWLIARSRDAHIRRENYTTCGQYLGQKLNWVSFGLGGAFVLLVIFAPFFIAAPEQVSFGLFGYHSGRDSGGLLNLLILKGGFISRFVQAYFLFTVLTLSALFVRMNAKTARATSKRQLGFSGLLWLVGIAITAIHISAPFPYDDYQVIAFPVLAMALVATLMPRIPQRLRRKALLVLFLASLAGSFSSPINQDWLVRGRDRIWWKFKGQSDLALLREVGDYLEKNSNPEDLILTQDTYLAVESKRRVPPGMEMGPFCYYPEMASSRARKLHLLNREMLSNLLARADAPIAALSGYGLAIKSPAIKELDPSERETFKKIMRRTYEPERRFQNFGQAHTDLEIFFHKRKPQSEPEKGK